MYSRLDTKIGHMRLLRILGGVVLGYAILIIGITLVQEVWLERPHLGETKVLTIITVGLACMFVSAVGGFMAGVVSGKAGMAPQKVMSVLILIETTVLVWSGQVDNPFWFEILAAASLIFSILAGGWCYHSQWRHKLTGPA